MVSVVRNNEGKRNANVTGRLTGQSELPPPGRHTNVQRRPTTRLDGMYLDVMMANEQAMRGTQTRLELALLLEVITISNKVQRN